MMQLSLLDWQPELVQKVAVTAKPTPTTSNQVLQVWRCTNGFWHYTGQMGFESALTLRPGDVALPVGEMPAPPVAAPELPGESGAPSAYYKVLFQMHWRKAVRGVSITGLLYCPGLLFWLMAIAAESLNQCHQCQYDIPF